MDLLNAYLHRHNVPVCFKAATIIPVPKKPKVKGLNDFRPVPLTLVAMKVLDRLVLTYLKSVTNSSSPTGKTDALMMLLPWCMMQHLESPNIYARIYARILFVDYTSAFDPAIPHNLHDLY